MWLVTNYVGRENASTLVGQMMNNCYYLCSFSVTSFWFPSCVMRKLKCRALTLSVRICFKPEKLMQKLWTNLWHWNLIYFRHYHVDMDSCKCASSWWCVKEHKFLIIDLSDKFLGFLWTRLKQKGFSQLLESSLHSISVNYKLTTLTKWFLLAKIGSLIQGLGVLNLLTLHVLVRKNQC